MPNTTNFNWVTPADTDLVKDGAAAIRTLGNGVDASFVDLKGGTTGQVLSKASNTDLDYSWVTPNVGDITEVQAGTGISVASGTGPIPVVTNTVATAYDAKGDLIVGTGADTFAKLTVGTNGYTLVSDSSTSTGLAWAAASSPAFVGCSLYGTTETANFNANTNYEITWANEEFDTDSFHSTSSDTGRITIPSGKGGKYQINAQLQIDDNTNQNLTIKLYKNGAEIKSSNSYQVASVGRFTAAVNVIVDVVATDYLQIYYFSTGASYVPRTQIRTWFQAAYLGA